MSERWTDDDRGTGVGAPSPRSRRPRPPGHPGV